MNTAEQIQYLANIYHLARSDMNLDGKEDTEMERIAEGIGCGYIETRKALDLSMSDGFEIEMPERFSDRIRNFEDMLFIAMCDGQLKKVEKKIITEFAKTVDITKDQFEIIKNQAKKKFQSM